MAQQIYVKTVQVLRANPQNNIIICRRAVSDEVMRTFYRDLANNVANSPNEVNVVQNTVYAIKMDKGWHRAMLKFVRRSDGVPVLQLLDKKSTIDFLDNVIVRKVSDPKLYGRVRIEFKLFVYGIGTYIHDDDFYSIFDQHIKGKKITCIYTLLEEKENKINECFVGDLLYEEGGRMRSFRELLIRKKITYPSRSKNDINRRLFQIRTNVLAGRNIHGYTTRMTQREQQKPIENAFFEHVPIQYEVPIDTIRRLENIEIVGEGAVSI